MKILIVSPKNKTVFNFRGDLIRDMISSGHEVIVTGPNREYVEDIIALGVTSFEEVPLVKDNTSLKGDLCYFYGLRNVIRKVSPDLVFSYTIKPVIYGSLAAKSCGVRRIYAMVTGLGRVYAAYGMKARFIRIITNVLYKLSFSVCNRVIFQNEDDISVLVSGHCLPMEKSALVNGSGVNMSRFVRMDLPMEPVFLMVSRIIREKGVLEYCEAAEQVRRSCPNAKFILLGGFDKSLGSLRMKDLEPYINQGTILYPGEVKDPVDYYGKASVFVLPSYYREGLPRTILEAMSCGRVVVTTNWPGCREPILDGKNGFLVPIKDAQTLAQKLLSLARDRNMLTCMANEAYKTCLESYEVSIVNKQMREIIGY